MDRNEQNRPSLDEGTAAPVVHRCADHRIRPPVQAISVTRVSDAG